jgi:hypothetical protein
MRMRKSYQQDKIKETIEQIQSRISCIQSANLEEMKKECILKELERRKASFEQNLRKLRENQVRQRNYRSRTKHIVSNESHFESFSFQESHFSRTQETTSISRNFSIGNSEESHGEMTRLITLLVNWICSSEGDFLRVLIKFQHFFEKQEEATRRLLLLRNKYVTNSTTLGDEVSRIIIYLACSSS